MPDNNRYAVLRTATPFFIKLGLFSLIAVLIYTALYFSNPHLAPVHVSYFSNGARKAQLHYDTGYGFTEAQKVELCAISNSSIRDLDHSFGGGPVALRFEVADQNRNE